MQFLVAVGKKKFFNKKKFNTLDIDFFLVPIVPKKLTHAAVEL